MKIALDAQVLQSDSRYRGIGRYTKCLFSYLTKNLREYNHEVIWIYNNAIKNEALRSLFDLANAVDATAILGFEAFENSRASFEVNASRRLASTALRECFLDQLGVDLVYLPSVLAEGWNDDTVTSSNMFGFPYSVYGTLHDLIPLQFPNHFLINQKFKNHYNNRIKVLNGFRKIFTISEAVRSQAIELLNYQPDKLENISSCTGDMNFKLSSKHVELLSSLNIKKGDFVLAVPGGADWHKNLTRLVEAHAQACIDFPNMPGLVVASDLPSDIVRELRSILAFYSISDEKLVFSGYLQDEQLVDLYFSAKCLIVPSLFEGFGLPVLEAMLCDCPVIGSSGGGTGEVISNARFLFDPTDVENIKASLWSVCFDLEFIQSCIENGRCQRQKYSWENTTKLLINSLDKEQDDGSSDVFVPSLPQNYTSEDVINWLKSDLNISLFGSERISFNKKFIVNSNVAKHSCERG